MPHHRRTRQPETARHTCPRPVARRLPVTLLIFVSGAVLMALENAGRPGAGPSLRQLGVRLGQPDRYLSRRHERLLLAVGTLAAAGAAECLAGRRRGFTLLLPLWAAPLCQTLTNGPEGLIDLGPRLGHLTASLILFALPSLLMGVASPFAVRLLARDLEDGNAVDNCAVQVLK